MFLRNRFLGAYDASIVATFPVEIQKFISDGQAEDPVFMDSYLTEVLASANPLDRIVKDLADSFVTLEASDFGLAGLGSIGSIFKKIANAVISIHQRLFSGLKKGVRVVERVWHKYGNVILQVIGTVLGPFTFGISMAVAAVLVTANNMYQRKQAILKAKDQSRDAENAALAEAAAAEAETTAQVDKFYSDNQDWFVKNLNVGPDKWAQLTLDQKIGLLKTGDTGQLPPDSIPVMTELIPITDIYKYGPVNIGIDADVLTSPPPIAKISVFSRTAPGPLIPGAPLGYPSSTDLMGRYLYWLAPPAVGTGFAALAYAKQNPPRNQVYRPIPIVGGFSKYAPAPGSWHESERSLTEALNQAWPKYSQWLLDNFGITKAGFDQLSIDQKFGLFTSFPPKGAVFVGKLQGPAVAQMLIPPPPAPPAPAVPSSGFTLPPTPPVVTSTGTPTPLTQHEAVNQATELASNQIAAGVPYSQAVQSAVNAVTGQTSVASGSVQQPATASLFGDSGGLGPVAMIGGLVLSFMQEKGRKARRNPSRRRRRA